MSEALIKGRPVLDTARLIREKDGEAAYEKAIRQLDPSVHELFLSPILDNLWYPLDAYAQLLELVVRDLLGGDEQRLLRRSEQIIEKQLSGIYKLFVRLGSPESLIRRISAVHQTYFKNVGIEVVKCTEGAAQLLYIGLSPQHRIIGMTIRGFYKRGLEISGAKDVQVEFTVPIELGGPHAQLDITWH